MARIDQPRPVNRVAIVGAGFSGALQAINLLRHDGPSAMLIERRGDAGRGVAYSAAHPSHLLNVRAANMSAFPDEPDHFVRWLAANRPDLSGFVPRIVYGDYLRDLLDDAKRRAGDRLGLIRGDAVDLAMDGDTVRLRLADGGTIEADRAILAAGNLPPLEPPEIATAGLPADLYAPDPWTGDLATGLSDDDTVLAIGSGLTMVDVALLLEAKGFRGRIVAMSRRGLAPRAHVEQPYRPLGYPERPPLDPVALLRFVREAAADGEWRAAVDGLRPHTQDIWLGASDTGRSRFLRHLRPWWDVHRHRLAPEVASRIAEMQARGQLSIVAGKLSSVERESTHARVRWRPRGDDRIEALAVRRIVNCSGPMGNLDRATDPLLLNLRKAGLIRADRHRLGIEVNAAAETIGANGLANPRLLALGPMTRGAFWEIVAVPDIRTQTWSVARKLANAHWVGGEGL